MKKVVYLLFTTLIIASCGSKTTKEQKTEELTKLKKERAAIDQKIAALELEANKSNPVKATPVSVIEVSSQAFNSFVEVQAQITGDENVLATSQAPGVVRRIHVQPGQRVGRGQTLATLDASAIEQQVRAQEAQLSLVRQLYDKQQKLWAQNIGTQVQLLQAKAQYESALAQKQALLAQRAMYTIKSPITGVVDEVKLKEGDMAAPGQNGIRVVSKDKLKAQASLGENYLGKVKQGDAVTLIFPEANQTIQTKLTYVAQSVDPVARAFNVEVRLPANANLHPNMSCKMKIANYANNAALVIPVAVIQKTNEGDIVYVADGKKAKAVSVITGRNSNGMVEILGGLNAGDKVITAGFEDLDNGEAISIQ
jgi:membrane fusion protein, multidrug efflux system